MIARGVICMWVLMMLLQAPVNGQDSQQVKSGLGFRLQEGKGSHNIPFELIDNLVVVKVVVNGTLPLKFIVDTGVRTSILTEKTFTDLLNITYTRQIGIPVPGGTQIVKAFVAPNINMNINGLVGRGHALLVLEEDLLELKNILGHNVQGILGYELFSRFIIEINYQNRMITLYEPEAFAKKNFDKKRKFVRVPITVEDTKPYCYTTLVLHDGTEMQAKLMLDTGASHAVLLDEASSDEISVPEQKIYSHLGRGLGGDIKGYIARINELEIDRFTFDDVIVTYPEKQFYEQETEKVYRNGTMGGGVFSRFRIIFDFVHGYIYLKKNKKYKKPFEYNLSGVVVKARGLYLNTFEIISVREGSTAAEAGLRQGDNIIRINGQLTRDMTLDEIQTLLNSKPNRVLRMQVSRDGKNMNAKFKLDRII